MISLGSKAGFTADFVINELPACGASNGSVTIITSEESEYAYSWGDTNTRTDLAAGLHQVVVVDQNTGCEQEVVFALTDETTPVTITMEAEVFTSCAGALDGRITPDIVFPADFAQPATKEIRDVGGRVYENGTLNPGDFCLVVLDANGCITGQQCFSVISPLPIVVDVITTDRDCDNLGAATVTVSGGRGAYNFVWSDGQQMNGSGDRTDLPEGNYELVVTDAFNCEAVAMDIEIQNTCMTIDTTVTNPTTDTTLVFCPTIVIANVVQIGTDCGTTLGAALIETQEPASNFTYTWTPNVGTSNAADNGRTNLPVGGYEVVVARAGNPDCNTIVTIAISDNAAADIPEPRTDAATCLAGDGVIDFSAAPANFTFTWADGPITNIRTDLPANDYAVTITDSNNPTCPNVVLISLGSKAGFTADFVINDLPACGASNGSVTIITSEESDYAYSWGDTDTRSDLAAGLHQVVVVDQNTGCEQEVVFALTDEITPVTIVLETPVFTSCTGILDGRITPDITFPTDFAQPATTEIRDVGGQVYENGSINPGDFCLVVLDANGCIAGQQCFSVINPPPLVVDVITTDRDCDNLGAATVLLVEEEESIISFGLMDNK